MNGWPTNPTPEDAVRIGIEYAEREIAEAAKKDGDEELRHLRFAERISYDWAVNWAEDGEWEKAIWAITAGRYIRQGRLAYWERRMLSTDAKEG
jgi:hypothetical protein